MVTLRAGVERHLTPSLYFPAARARHPLPTFGRLQVCVRDRRAVARELKGTL